MLTWSFALVNICVSCYYFFVKNSILNLIPIIAKPISKEDAFKLPPMSLAFIGDSVHSLLSRSLVTIGNEKHTNELHKEVTKDVCAKKQAIYAEILLEHFDETEKDIFRRARNSRIHTTAKHAAISEYRKASGFEAVIGFLYLTQQTTRLVELLEIANIGSNEIESSENI